MDKITRKLKQRFCKDCGIPINLFADSYFEDRIELYDSLYHTVEKWGRFTSELTKYDSEQAYLENYNRVKDAAIDHIKSQPAWEHFQNEDMNKFAVSYDYPARDVYKESNCGRCFISIDMKKANFSSLNCYSPSIFRVNGVESRTWEEFISNFTDSEHIKSSKYIRQVILGNCNPKRQTTFERFLMGTLVKSLEEHDIKSIVSFSTDEIVIDITDLQEERLNVFSRVDKICMNANFPTKVEMFILNKGTVGNSTFYYKQKFNSDMTLVEATSPNALIELKCIDAYMLPFVMRHYNKEEARPSDKVFENEYGLCSFLGDIEVRFEGAQL